MPTWFDLPDWLVKWTDHPTLKLLVPVLSIAAGYYLKRLVDWVRWRRRQFLHRLMVSLNSFDADGTLRIRTLLEKGVEDIFLNTYAARVVMQAAAATRPGEPLLDLPKDEAWHVLNSVLNEVAEVFPEGPLRRDMGLPVHCRRYVLCLTHERAPDVRQEKIRAMLVREDVLDDLPATAKFESPHHSLRLETLRHMRDRRRDRPELFFTVELCLSCESGQANRIPGEGLSDTLAADRRPASLAEERAAVVVPAAAVTPAPAPAAAPP